MENLDTNKEIPPSSEKSLEEQIDDAFKMIQAVPLDQLLKKNPEAAEQIKENQETAEAVLSTRDELINGLKDKGIDIPPGFDGKRANVIFEALAGMKKKTPEVTDDIDPWSNDSAAKKIERKI